MTNPSHENRSCQDGFSWCFAAVDLKLYSGIVTRGVFSEGFSRMGFEIFFKSQGKISDHQQK
jgi:hypothetical protein